MSGGQQPRPVQNYDLRPDTSDNSNLTDLGAAATATTSPQQSQATSTNYSVSSTSGVKNPSKKAKIFAIVFAVLFVLVAGFAAYQYTQIQDLKKKNEALNTQVKQLEGQLFDVKYKSKDNVTQIDIITKQSTALRATALQLKAACGNACKDIQVK